MRQVNVGVLGFGTVGTGVVRILLENRMILRDRVGADLNLNFPSWNSDRHAKIYAIGDGTVTYARRFSATNRWG